jgi:hypothetical protein
LAVEVNGTVHDSYGTSIARSTSPLGSGLALEYIAGNVEMSNSERIIKTVTTYLKEYFDWTLLEEEESTLLMREIALSEWLLLTIFIGVKGVG